MYLHFFNLNDQYNPGSAIIGPCFLNITRGFLRVSPAGDEEGAEIRTTEGSYIVNGKTFSDIETLESLEFAPADCKILTPDEFGEQEEAIRSFVCHGTCAYSNACGYEVELSPDGESARLRINGNEPTATVTDWLPIESRPAETDNFEYTLPNWALSAVVNDDYTALTDEDEDKLNKFISKVEEEHGNAHFIVGTDMGFCHKNDMDNLGADCTQCFICPDTYKSVIDPDGYNVPLSEVMRIN